VILTLSSCGELGETETKETDHSGLEFKLLRLHLSARLTVLMLRFIFVCSVLISTSGVLAQKRTYSPSVNRILVPANSINPAQNTDERESKIRLHQLIDSIESRQGATGAKNDKEYGEKKSPAVSVLSNPEDVISQRMNKEAAAICYDTSSRFFFKNDS
jgi:hypothetical protein